MKKLSIKNLDLIPHIPLTTELVQSWHPVSDDDAADIRNTVLHEAAHLLAVIACGGRTYSLSINKNPSTTIKGYAGKVNPCVATDEQDAFVCLTGYALECTNGDPHRAADDLHHAKAYEHSDRTRGLGFSLDVVERKAHKFLAIHQEKLNHAAVGILCLLPKSGVMDHAKLRKLCDWLRPGTLRYEYL